MTVFTGSGVAAICGLEIDGENHTHAHSCCSHKTEKHHSDHSHSDKDSSQSCDMPCCHITMYQQVPSIFLIKVKILKHNRPFISFKAKTTNYIREHFKPPIISFFDFA